MAGRAQHRVRVSLQSLHDLLALQIPNVHHLVLAARHDPLAARHREIRKDAILFVPVPRVRLQALALRVVPQLQRVVQRRSQDVFPIRRELDETHRRILVVDQRLQALSAGSIPDPAQTVVAAAHDQRTVPIEVHGGHGVGMRGQRLQAFTGAHVPDANRLVETARHDQVALRVEVAAEDVVGVSLERLQKLSMVQFPDLKRLIVAGTDQQSTVAAPSNVTDAQLMAGDCLVELAVVRTPDLDQLVGGCN